MKFPLIPHIQGYKAGGTPYVGQPGLHRLTGEPDLRTNKYEKSVKSIH